MNANNDEYCLFVLHHLSELEYILGYKIPHVFLIFNKIYLYEFLLAKSFKKIINMWIQLIVLFFF